MSIRYCTMVVHELECTLFTSICHFIIIFIDVVVTVVQCSWSNVVHQLTKHVAAVIRSAVHVHSVYTVRHRTRTAVYSMCVDIVRKIVDTCQHHTRCYTRTL